ncbi:MAG TPA: polyphosphate polymerase domain-containing protein [Mobilitalea sp.]|nr:polyphosphate polymerase domain-containing protein [Mobilitalea sp.]
MDYRGHKLRHEYKYYINTFVYHEIRERLRQVLHKDSNMKDDEGYLISSLYFDDVFNSAEYEKINGTRFRKKYRIRLYNHDDSLIKLECKIKFNNYISKEGAVLTRQEYDSILKGDYEFLISRNEDICKKIYSEFTANMLRPVTVVEYLREAYVHELGNVRITFDKNISASIGSLDVFDPDYETVKVPLQGMMVMEVKYDDYIPDYIRKIIHSGQMVGCAISKYIMCRDINRKVRMI